MRSIERMTRYGPSYLIVLDCGHKMQRSRDEVKRMQLFVGKRIGCQECEEAGR